MTVTTRMAKAVTFISISLSSIVPKYVMAFPIAVGMNARLLTFASRSVTAYILVVRSTGSFIATANNVREMAFSEKNLLGNQCFFLWNPWKVSAAIARVQIREAAATYMPIHGIGAWSCFSTSAAKEYSPGISSKFLEDRHSSTEAA